jgi:hypothetical protein
MKVDKPRRTLIRMHMQLAGSWLSLVVDCIS